MLEYNHVYNGDCLEIMKSIDDKSLDLILCDLPYGTTKCKWDIVIPFAPLWEQYRRIIKDNGAILLFGTEPFSSRLRISAEDLYRYDWYWKKDKAANFLFGNKMPLKIIETISCFYKSQPTYNPQKTINPKGTSKRHLSKNPSKISHHVKSIMGDSWRETEMDSTQNYHGANYEPDKLLPTTLIYYAKDQRGKIHPTQKPTGLLEYLIKTYTNENDLVLDNCSGSGSTLLAAINTKRRYIGIESNLHYYQSSLDRINQHLESQI